MNFTIPTKIAVVLHRPGGFQPPYRVVLLDAAAPTLTEADFGDDPAVQTFGVFDSLHKAMVVARECNVV